MILYYIRSTSITIISYREKMKLFMCIITSLLLTSTAFASLFGDEINCKVKDRPGASARIILVSKLLDESVLEGIIIRLTNPYTVIKLDTTKKPDIFRVIKQYYYVIFDIKAKTIYKKDIVTKKVLQAIYLVNCSSEDDLY